MGLEQSIRIDGEIIIYWRKAYVIHDWFCDQFEDEAEPFRLSKEHIEGLLAETDEGVKRDLGHERTSDE